MGHHRWQLIEIGPRSKYVPHGYVSIVASVDPGVNLEAAQGFFAAMNAEAKDVRLL